MSLKQYLWQQDYTDELKAVVARFKQCWQELSIASHNLLLHIIAVQQVAENIQRLVVIVSLAWPDLMRLAYYCEGLARGKAGCKAKRLDSMIYKLLHIKTGNGEWGYHSWSGDEKREAGTGERLCVSPCA